MPKDSLTITDNRTGQSYEVPIRERHNPRPDLRKIKTDHGRFRAHDLRPGVHEHGLVQEPDHLHRRRQGHPPLPRVSDRAAGREEQLPRDRLPAHVRGAADQEPARRPGPTTSPTTPWSTRTSRSMAALPLRRPPHGHARLDRRRPVHVLSGGEERPRPDECGTTRSSG